MKANDIEIKVNSGDYKGKKYGFTLASKSGIKQWAVTPLFQPAPSIYKEKIDFAIAARESNIPTSGANELQIIANILDDLRKIAQELTASTMVGLDEETRLIQIDENGYTIESSIAETGREPEYIVRVTAWSIYDTT